MNAIAPAMIILGVTLFAVALLLFGQEFRGLPKSEPIPCVCDCDRVR